MASKQRVFAHQSNINYNDYLKNKNGIQLIKNLQSKKINKEINMFISYEQFLILSKTYFKYRHVNDCIIDPLKNIYDSNTSYLIYEKLLFHMDRCSCCSSKKTNIFDCIFCPLVNDILYPYGEYISTNNTNNNNFYFPSKLNLDEFCIQKKNICNEKLDFSNLKTDNPIVPIFNKCKNGLCKNAKPLFV